MNDSEHDEVIRPVAAPDYQQTEPPRKHGDFYSRCVFLLAILVGLAAVILSGVAFAGFAENDQNPTHLMSAFGTSFGTGALAFGPMILVAIYARTAIYTPLPRYRALIVILLMLPWFVLAYFIFKIGDIWRLVAMTGTLVVLFITIWAARFLNAR